MTELEIQIIALQKEIRDTPPSMRRTDLEKCLRRKRRELLRRLTEARNGGTRHE